MPFELIQPKSPFFVAVDDTLNFKAAFSKPEFLIFVMMFNYFLIIRLYHRLKIFQFQKF